MRKIYAILAAAAVLSLAGCTKELIKDTGIQEPGLEVEEVILCATHADYEVGGDGEDTPQTRTVLRNTKEVWWSSGDKIKVYPSTSSTGAMFTSTLASGQPSRTSYFTGSLNLKKDKDFHVVYPYPAAKSYSTSLQNVTLTLSTSQYGLRDSIYPSLMLSYGSFTNSDLSFTMKPAYGGLKFQLSRDDIKSIKFESNTATGIAGDYSIKVTETNPNKIVVSRSGDNCITLKPHSSDSFQSGRDYFIVLIPGTLSKGFTATLTTTGGKQYAVTTSKSIKIKPGVFGTLAKPLNEYATVQKEYVDLGLPSGTKWATFNVGAEAPEEYGDYFAWGETEPKTDYSWSTYLWCNGSETTITKYNTNASYGTVDHKILLDANDDAATANWGGSWRMPTYDEWRELRSNCTWTWTTQNGVEGRLVTSKTNSNSIFLPAAGYRYSSGRYAEEFGYYYSSSLYTTSPIQACFVIFGSGSYFYYREANRYHGFSVRPVYGALVPVTSVGISIKDFDLEPGKTQELIATVYPDNATDKRVSWGSSDESIATVDQDGTVTAVSKGKATITVYSADGSKSQSLVVTVAVKPQAVDLGLPSGTKWATFNVGAGAPEDYGDYFAWGETEPKTEYSWSTYKWCNGSSNTLTRYCPASKTDFWGGSGSPDGKFLFKYYDYEDDAARVNWGGSWCMPTEAEWKELQDNCTWTWTTQNGVNGRLVTGSNSNSIFLPAASYRRGTSLYDVGSDGYYWSSSLSTGNPSYAYRIGFNSDRVYGYYSERGDGFSVRPVLLSDK